MELPERSALAVRITMTGLLGRRFPPRRGSHRPPPAAVRTATRRSRDAAPARPRVRLVWSPGEHLQQLLALAPAREPLEHGWVTLPGSDVEELLADEQPLLAYGPTNRSLRNLPFAWRTIHRLDPDVILSTGAGLAVPSSWSASCCTAAWCMWRASPGPSRSRSAAGWSIRARTSSSSSGRKLRRSAGCATRVASCDARGALA